MKSYRTSTSQGGSHSKKTSFRCPLAYPRKRRTIPLFYLFKDIEIRANSKILDLKGSWETSQHLCLTDEKKPKSKEDERLNQGWTVASGFWSRACSIPPSYTFLWVNRSLALQITTKFLPLLAILLILHLQIEFLYNVQ